MPHGHSSAGAGEIRAGHADAAPAACRPRVGEEALAQAAQVAGKSIDRHRDGTKGIYVSDPDGNQVELICYPLGETVYE